MASDGIDQKMIVEGGDWAKLGQRLPRAIMNHGGVASGGSEVVKANRRWRRELGESSIVDQW